MDFSNVCTSDICWMFCLFLFRSLPHTFNLQKTMSPQTNTNKMKSDSKVKIWMRFIFNTKNSELLASLSSSFQKHSFCRKIFFKKCFLCFGRVSILFLNQLIFLQKIILHYTKHKTTAEHAKYTVGADSQTKYFFEKRNQITLRKRICFCIIKFEHSDLKALKLPNSS